MLTNRDSALRSVRETLTEQLAVTAGTERDIRELSETIVEKIWEEWGTAGPLVMVLPLACPRCGEQMVLPPWYVSPHLVIDSQASWLKLSVSELPIIGHNCPALLN